MVCVGHIGHAEGFGGSIGRAQKRIVCDGNNVADWVLNDNEEGDAFCVDRFSDEIIALGLSIAEAVIELIPNDDDVAELLAVFPWRRTEGDA